MKKGLMLVVIIGIAVVAVFAWAEFFSQKPVFCTQDAKLCLDGSYVGRTGPNCKFAPCPSANIGQGTIRGKVLLGPICPVEKNPPDPVCSDKLYKTTIQIIKIGSPQGAPFATVETDTNGMFEKMLPAGEYALQPTGGNPLPRCETKDIIVEPDKTMEINLSCDTGIR